VVGPLIALLLVLGFYPAPAIDLVRAPAVVTLERVGIADVPVAATGAAASDPRAESGTDEGSTK